MSVKTNIIANYAGSVWTALMGLVFVPTYIKFLGIEAYGLVGFMGTILAVSAALDLGLSATLNRELARRSTSPVLFLTTRDFLRTVEVIYWSIAFVLGGVIVILSYPISRYWINPGKLSVEDVQQALMIMGLVVVFRWPFGMYQGGLMGLQLQIPLNVIISLSATLRGLGAVIVLWFFSNTIQAFFIWQIVVSALETLSTALFLWIRLPPSKRYSQFQSELVREVWKFAGSMIGVNLFSLILLQTDKLLLSKLLSLEMFGYYMLAWTVAGTLYKLVGPVVGALFPRFTQLAVTHDSRALIQLYHVSCQFMSIVLLPVAAVLTLFSYQLLLIWTDNAEIATNSYLVFCLLVLGNTCNGLMNIPYAVQLAYGWTSLAFWVNLVSIVLLIPALYLLVIYYGALGGAMVWAALNLGYVTIAIRIMHWRLLKGELFKWYRNDILIPLFVSVLVALAACSLFQTTWSNPTKILFLGGTIILTMIMACLCARDVRKLAFTFFQVMRLAFERGDSVRRCLHKHHKIEPRNNVRE